MSDNTAGYQTGKSMAVLQLYKGNSVSVSRLRGKGDHTHGDPFKHVLCFSSVMKTEFYKTLQKPRKLNRDPRFKFQNSSLSIIDYIMNLESLILHV